MRTRGAIGVVLIAVCVSLWAVSVASASVTAAQAALTIQVADDVGGFARYGSTVTFTYTVANAGDETVTAISVDDTLAGHLGDIAVLAPGQTVSFSAPVVIDGAAAGGVGTCSANGTSEAAPVSASKDYAVEVFMADNVSDYAVTKRALARSAAPGAIVRYQMRVRVATAGIGTAVRLVDDYDEKAMTVVDAGGGAVTGGRITWDVPEDLASGESFSVECALRVRPGVRGPIENEAVLEPEGPDPNTANDRSSATVRAVPAVGGGVDGETGAEARGSRAASGRVDDFLPFTGPPAHLAALAWLFGALGYGLRRFSAA